ncbi:hypothetical protein [Streptomyces sp. B1I3]|uniref:hypothetical protein n=1 Tax=Streptomyces sp. B1I3 TaxID=3042264 RepID=UPI00278579C7|nr:hypothetical protein [Streptomyces sp. B1I3]MDQ0794917.1 hypothetical protein [Streptomyces sp. B1I3]
MTSSTDAGPSGLALPLGLAAEPAASAQAPVVPRPAEVRTGAGRRRRAARRRAAAVRG